MHNTVNRLERLDFAVNQVTTGSFIRYDLRMDQPWKASCWFFFSFELPLENSFWLSHPEAQSQV